MRIGRSMCPRPQNTDSTYRGGTRSCGPMRIIFDSVILSWYPPNISCFWNRERVKVNCFYKLVKCEGLQKNHVANVLKCCQLCSNLSVYHTCKISLCCINREICIKGTSNTGTSNTETSNNVAKFSKIITKKSPSPRNIDIFGVMD